MILQEKTPSFAEVSWVGLSSYTNEIGRQGRHYFVYKQGNQTAWIDEETRLPAFYTSPQMAIAYTYKDAPTAPLELPEDMKKRVATIQNALRGR